VAWHIQRDHEFRETKNIIMIEDKLVDIEYVMRWITFDCFGTLIDWRSGFFDLLSPIGGDRTEELVRAYHKFERQLERDRPHMPYRNVLKEGISRAAEVMGLSISNVQKETLAKGWGTQKVFPDVEPALAGLRADGWKLAVLTNCDANLFLQTERSFLRPFDLVVTAEEVADYKPSLAHFNHFWRVSGAEKRDWIHVACSWYHDVKPARGMGVRCIWLDRDRTGEDPTMASMRIESAAALQDAVRQLALTGNH
jgi:2-haloacid dehalogenase